MSLSSLPHSLVVVYAYGHACVHACERVCMCVSAHVCICVYVVRGQLTLGIQLALPCGTPEPNSGCQGWQQALPLLSLLSSPKICSLSTITVETLVLLQDWVLELLASFKDKREKQTIKSVIQKSLGKLPTAPQKTAGNRESSARLGEEPSQREYLL